MSTITVDVSVQGITAADAAPGPRTRLIGARPNPFNPATEILFEIPRAMHVSLVVYDVAGRRVRELASGYRDAGLHRVRWNGTDRSGRAVSSGVYYARLRVEGDEQTRPLTLVR